MTRDLDRLWAAFAVSTFGTFIAFDAFPLVAILTLDATATQVSLLASAGVAAGAVAGLPLGAWVERRRKRGVMVAMDLVRGAALLGVVAVAATGRLAFAHLLVVGAVVSTADIAFRAASGAYLKRLVRDEELVAASARFEATTWSATAVGPPLGGVAVALLGPVATVAVNAASFLLSALGLRGLAGEDDTRTGGAARAPGASDLLAGWHAIRASPTLRPLLANTVLVNALILATAPLMAVLMLEELGFAPWEYALAFGAPCAGGLLGARLAPRLVARHGAAWVLRTAGTVRACWSIGLAFVCPGVGGLVLVVAVQLALVTSIGAFNPVLAATRLEHAPPDRVARVLAAWSVASGLTIATLTAAWGVLAALVGPRAAIAAAGVLLLATPLLLPRGRGQVSRRP